MKRKDPADSGIEGRQAKRHAGAEEASDNCSNDSTAIQNTGGSSPRSAQTYFRAGLLDRKEQDRVRERYASSKPSVHSVLSGLVRQRVRHGSRGLDSNWGRTN